MKISLLAESVFIDGEPANCVTCLRIEWRQGVKLCPLTPEESVDLLSRLVPLEEAGKDTKDTIWRFALRKLGYGFHCADVGLRGHRFTLYGGRTFRSVLTK